MREYWTQVTDPDDQTAVALNNRPKYLVSATVNTPDWGDTTVLGDDLLTRVRQLKDTPADGELQFRGHH